MGFSSKPGNMDKGTPSLLTSTGVLPVVSKEMPTTDLATSGPAFFKASLTHKFSHFEVVKRDAAGIDLWKDC